MHLSKPIVPDEVTFETDIVYSNPDNQHLQLNMARPKNGTGTRVPFRLS
jgi:hypothetical protein